MAQEKNEKQKTISEAKTSVFRYLKYRPRSEQEIIDKLTRKDFPQEIIQKAVDYFKKIGAINDRQFALGWCRSRLNKPVGIHRIRQELKHKGIDQTLIDSALDDATHDYHELETLRVLAQQRARKYAHLDKLTARRRLYGYLARRGFNNGAIIKTLNQIFS